MPRNLGVLRLPLQLLLPLQPLPGCGDALEPLAESHLRARCPDRPLRRHFSYGNELPKKVKTFGTHSKLLSASETILEAHIIARTRLSVLP